MPGCDKNGSPIAFKTLHCCTGPGHSASKGYDNSTFEVLNTGHHSCSTGGPQQSQRTRMPGCDKNGSPIAFKTLHCCTGPGHSASKGYDNSTFEVLNTGHHSTSAACLAAPVQANRRTFIDLICFEQQRSRPIQLFLI